VLGPPTDGARRRSPIVLVIAALVVLAAGGAAVVVSGVLKHGSTAPRPIGPLEKTTTGPSTNATPSATSSSQSPRVVIHGLQTPFAVDGARFAVFVNARQAWTTFANTVSAGPGNRWVLVTVRVRNMTRVGFDPRVLHYRLMAGDIDYFPDLSYGTGPALRQPPNPLAGGELVQAELAFHVPTSAIGLELAFDPTGGHERVEVRLGR
jgi:hypothetical protein